MSLWGMIFLSWGFSALYLGAAHIYYGNLNIEDEIKAALKGGDILDQISQFQETTGGSTNSKIPFMLGLCVALALYTAICLFPINRQADKSVAVLLLIVNGICQNLLIWDYLRVKNLYLKKQKKPWWFTKAEYIRNGHAPRILYTLFFPLSVILYLIVIVRIII